MRRGMVCVGVAVIAVAAWGMPTQKEIDQVKPLVEELMASQKNAKPQEAAEAALGLVPDAEIEAAKYLLYLKALDLYAKSGEDEKTVETFKGLVEAIPDVPYGIQAKLLLDARRAIFQMARPVQTEALCKQVNALAAIERELQKALKEIEADPNDAAAHLRAGNALAIFGEWPKALEHLSVSESPVAAVADEERTERVSIGESADGWWKVADTIRNATLKKAYRSHAVDLYRKGIADGVLTGLGKTVAEKKIAEFEKESESVPVQPPKASGGKSNLYCVIDLKRGTAAKKYPVSYLKEPPPGGFNTDEYKTTKLVLRRIEPGTFKMHGEYDVTLTKPYYIGIFEVTQKQYELVTGERPAKYKGDMRPVEMVSFAHLYGKGFDWPTSLVIKPESFMGKLRARVGLKIDLPTEAQWEYACRAGTTSAYNNGGDSEDDMKKVGRYSGNRSDGKGGYAEHTTVGSYEPNAWGLYDMHGNINEWCLDYEGALTGGAIDPVGPSKGNHRMVRGGDFGSGKAKDCDSSNRWGINWWAFGHSHDYLGFRLARTVEK